MESALAERDRLIAELQARLVELEAQLRKDSSNSHKPPSSDPPWKPPRTTGKPGGRKRGGQRGHKGHRRELLPPEKVDEIVNHRPEKCWQCGGALSGDDPSPHRHQVTELPALRGRTTEHREHRLTCPCGAVNQGEMPRDARASSFGPNLTVLVAMLAGVYRLSQRNIEQLLGDVFHIDISLGSVTRLEQRVSDAVAAPVAEAVAEIVKSPSANADESSWRESRQKVWLWVVATATLAVFVIRKSRGADIAHELLDKFRGVLSSDRWSGYAWYEATRRQLCWAHLKRDFLGFADHGVDAAALSEKLLDQYRRMMRMWHRVRDGTLTRAAFQKRMRPVEAQILLLLGEGTRLSSTKVAGKCRSILSLKSALFTFVAVEGIEPTNNAAERALRHAVIWRKISFGTDSEKGSRFVERMLTVVTSLRLQRRNVMEWLTEAYLASLRRQPAPSLLPVTHDQPVAAAA